ncbi:hypothetical protein FRB90_004541 [Tulasnella sp. 427]|nr:hypothetical protein FRB90_004541 [Tulasnella sp. 427]
MNSSHADSPPRRPLSEKAKGKQRAVEIEDEDTPGAASSSSQRPQSPATRSVTIRFTEGVKDLTLDISERDTVREVKSKASSYLHTKLLVFQRPNALHVRQIRLMRPSLEKRRLRLIHSGRLLTDGTFLFSWIASLEEHQRRANIDTGASRPSTDSAVGDDPTGSHRPEPIWLHCSIGPEIQEEEEEEAAQPDPQIAPLRGFDRLISAGFTEEDIATIRRQFRSSRGLDQDAGPLEADGQDEHARALEEQWIDSLDGAGGTVDGSLDGSPDGLYTTLLQGVATGFFFSLLPFYFFRSRRRPAAFFSDAYEQLPPQGSVIYGKRMQMALVIGFFVNLALGILRYLYE